MALDKLADMLSTRREDIASCAKYSQECSDAILLFLDAYDPGTLYVKPPILDGKDKRESTLATSSRLQYASTLHRTAQHCDLVECNADDLNRLARGWLKGTYESAPDDGLAQNTIHQRQTAWRSFAQYHVNHPDGYDLELNPEDIVLVDREDTQVDDWDMFDSEEIRAMRDACQNKRDRAVLEMLIYTGQRHNALRMLKYRDVQPRQGESGIFYLPDVDEGLKGSDGKRPLLGAQKYICEWKDAHPTKEPDHAFFTHIYDWSGHPNIDPGDHLSRDAFGRITNDIAERAGVEKPSNPHQFRHYFVTQSIANHGVSMDTVRHLIGHAADSRELERTYQHLVDEDHIENAEIAHGVRDEREESLVPSTCPQCDEPLEQHYSVCPSCTYRFGPEAQDVGEEVDTRLTDAAFAVETDAGREQVQDAMEILEQPDVLEALAKLNRTADEFDSFSELIRTVEETT